MIVVIDTNILLVSISPQSKHHWVYKLFLEKKFQLAVSTEILLEYEEIIGRFMGETVAQSVLQAIVYAPNTKLISRWFCWNLVTNDPDDNKFVDACVAAGANYIVTEDKHFDVVNGISFPPIQIINLASFLSLMQSNS